MFIKLKMDGPHIRKQNVTQHWAVYLLYKKDNPKTSRHFSPLYWPAMSDRVNPVLVQRGKEG